ncbi:hypothetical protein [Salirhabdus salicampi]|uniref:hypothetical protein n=1 Tax=Salirhabdus salicampi TaxID=476102 RepID=UPI0020C3226C|nr:hypothetical protein [Salirhabdus salicampi]MCP8615693.1 hypothetical protein [Salirhabdus salicampi]
MTSTELHPISRLFGLLCYITTTMYLFETLSPNETIAYTYSVLSALLLGVAFFYISTINKIIVFVLLLIGTICIYVENMTIQQAILGFGENIKILALFLLIPLIGIFMKTAGYLDALKSVVQAKLGEQHPYRFSFILTAFISVLLNYGSIAIVKRIAEESLSNYQSKKLTLNIMRGFGVSMLWSPYFVNVGLVLIVFQLSWFQIGGYGFIMATVYIMMTWLFFKRVQFDNDPDITETDQDYTERLSMLPFILFSVTLVGLSFILDVLLPVNMLTIVCILALIFPILWALVTHTTSSYLKEVSEQVQTSFIKVKNELAVFISAGFFGLALAQTNIGNTIADFLLTISFGSIYLISLLIVIMMMGLAQIGIHPVIIIVGIGSGIAPESLGVSSIYMALCLLVSWTVATQTSPFSGQILLTSRLLNQPARILIKQNMLFALVVGMILITVLYCLHFIGLL